MIDEQTVAELDNLKRVVNDMSRRSERIEGLLQVGSAYSRATQLAIRRQEEKIRDLERRLGGEG